MTPTPAAAIDVGARPMRADARRNREKVLEAARAEFAACGPCAQMPDIAKRAGVGVGTVYRHFPTKEALVEALAQAHFAKLADQAEAAVKREGDPWAIFEEQIRTCAEQCAGDRGMAAAIQGSPEIMIAAAQEETRLRAATSVLMDRARASGQMRADATIDDMPMIMSSLAQVAEMERQGRPGFSWPRFLQIALDGMRAR